MRVRSRRTGATRRRVGVAILLALVGTALLTTPSSSAPGDPPGTEDLPPWQQIAQSQGAVTATQGTVVRRSKMYITVPSTSPIWGVLYNNMFNTPVDNPTAFVSPCGRNQQTCIADPFHPQPACATDDIMTQQRGVYFRYLLYPVSPLKSGVEVGKIAETRVNLIAFGSIPATATLTLRTPRVNGKVEPLRIQLWQTTRQGCDPSLPVGEVSSLVEGRVDITISDLRVDGVPVDIGPACTTARPAKLAVWGETQNGGYFPLTGGNLGGYDGLHGGSVGPLESPAYQQDRGRVIPASTGITVPPFKGCARGGDDISPLITAMASGPNNPVRIRQGTVIAPEAGVDLDNLEYCDPLSGACPLPAPSVPERPPLPAGE